MTEQFVQIAQVAQVDWKAVGVIFGILSAWTGLLVKIIAWLLKRNLSAYDDQIKTLKESISAEAKKRSDGETRATRKYEKLDGDFRRFLADLPKQYVQREDWIRTWTAVDAKMDSIWQQLMILNKGPKK